MGKEIATQFQETQRVPNRINPRRNRITVDLSIETLQARKEWQDILNVMKEKNLQPRLLYAARISFRYEGEIKSCTHKQKLRIQHHQTISPTNAKGSSLDRKHRRVYKLKPKTTK